MSCSYRRHSPPNYDGVNDYFVIGGLMDLYPNNNGIKIFNRRGGLVWESDRYENDWGGYDLNNRPLPVGTYYYILDLGEGRSPIRRFVFITR